MTLELAEIKKRLQNLTELSNTKKASRRKKALNNYRYFVQTYLPHYIDGSTEETSKFRNWVYDKLPTLSKKQFINLILAFRGGAKSTLISRSLSLWLSLKEETHYHVHISDGADLATENIEAIKIEFEENVRIKQDFNISAGNEWSTKSFIVKINNNLVKFQSFGSGSRIRGKNFLGHRPDAIFIDDLENDTNVESKLQRDKLTKWMIKTVFKLPDRNRPYNIYIVGTVLHFDSTLVRLSKRSDIYSYSFSGILKFPRNMHLWEELYSIAKNSNQDQAYEFYKTHTILLHQDLEVDDTSWLTLKENMHYPVIFSLLIDYFEDKKAFHEEIQMDSIDEESQIFKPIYYTHLPSDLIYYFGIDPALGKAKGDYSALVVLGVSKSTKKRYVVDAFIAKVHPDKFGEAILKKAKEYAPQKAGAEIVQFQEYYKDKLKQSAFSNNIKLPIVPLKNTIAKDIRIESVAPDVNDGSILCNPNLHLLLEQLTMYPKGHDDGPDALEMAQRVSFSSKDLAQMQKALNSKSLEFNYIKNQYL